MSTKDVLSDPKQLIPFLNRKLYEKGDSYSPGTGFCIKKDYKVYLAPAEINPDLLSSEDIYTFNEMLDENGNPDVDKAPENESLATSKYSKIYLHLLEEFSCNCVLLVESQSIKIAADLYSESLVFSNNECLTNITNTLTKEKLKFNDSLKIPIIPDKQPQDDLISDLINALYSNSPTCGCIIKGFGLILLGESWMSVRNMFETVKQFIMLELSSLQYRIRNDLTQQISHINHRIDNLAQQMNNNKHSPAALDMIQKLKNDENEESSSYNGVPTTEGSALQQDRLLIHKEDGQEEKCIDEQSQDIEMKEPLQDQNDVENTHIEALTAIEENDDKMIITEADTFGVNEIEPIEEDTNIEELEEGMEEVPAQEEDDLDGYKSDSEDTVELEAELDKLKKLKASTEVPIEIESDKEETIEIESDSEDLTEKLVDPSAYNNEELTDKSADLSATTTKEPNDKSSDTSTEPNDKSSDHSTSENNDIESDAINIEDKVDTQNVENEEASSNCDIINEKVKKDEFETNAAEEPVAKVTRRSSRRSAAISSKANAKPSPRKSKKSSPSKSNIQSDILTDSSSISTTIDTSTKNQISSESLLNASLSETNETKETVDASSKNIAANEKDNLEEAASKNVSKVPTRASTRSASKASKSEKPAPKPKPNTSKSILAENDLGKSENVEKANAAVDERNDTTKAKLKKTATAELESENTTIIQSESSKNTKSKDETLEPTTDDDKSIKALAEPEKTQTIPKKTPADSKKTEKAEVDTETKKTATEAAQAETKKTQAKKNETPKEDEGELDIQLTLSSMEQDELFEWFDEEPDYEAEGNSDDEESGTGANDKSGNDANDKSTEDDDDDDCCIIECLTRDSASPQKSTKSPQEKRKRPNGAESENIKRKKGDKEEKSGENKKRSLEELSALVMPRVSPAAMKIAKAALKNSSIAKVATSKPKTGGKLTATNIRAAMYKKSIVAKDNAKAILNKNVNFASAGSLGAWQASSTPSQESDEFEKSQSVWNKSMLETLKLRNEVPAQIVPKSKEEVEKEKIEATTAAAMKYAQDLARRAKSVPSAGSKPPSVPVMVTSATKESFRYSPYSDTGKSSNKYPQPLPSSHFPSSKWTEQPPHTSRHLPAPVQAAGRGRPLPSPVRSTNIPSKRYDGQPYKSTNMPNMMLFSGSNRPSNIPNMMSPTLQNNFANQGHEDELKHLSLEERQLWFRRQEIIREKKILMQEMGISEEEMRNFNF